MLPAWSPQGNQVAWAAASPKRALHVWVANADGSGLRNLTPTSSAGDRFPTWSPDETRFAFMSTRSKGIEIWTMNADGSSPLQLTNNVNIEDCCPDWSPAANWIAFESNRDGKFETYTMDPNGANVTRLMVNSYYDGTSQSRRTARGSHSSPRAAAAMTSG